MKNLFITIGILILLAILALSLGCSQSQPVNYQGLTPTRISQQPDGMFVVEQYGEYLPKAGAGVTNGWYVRIGPYRTYRFANSAAKVILRNERHFKQKNVVIEVLVPYEEKQELEKP